MFLNKQEGEMILLETIVKHRRSEIPFDNMKQNAYTPILED